MYPDPNTLYPIPSSERTAFLNGDKVALEGLLS